MGNMPLLHRIHSLFDYDQDGYCFRFAAIETLAGILLSTYRQDSRYKQGE